MVDTTGTQGVIEGLVDVVVIGAGPAGLAASARLGQAGLSVVLVERNLPGGQLYEEGALVDDRGAATTGDEFATALQEAVGNAGVEFQFGAVQGIDVGEPGIRVSTDSGPTECRAVVIATGSQRAPIVTTAGSVDQDLTTHCLPCDGPLLAGKRIAIVGTEAPFDRDLHLCLAVSAETTVIAPGADAVSGGAHPVDGTVVAVGGARGAFSLTVRVADGSERVVDADAIVAAQGFLPSAPWLPSELLDESGWVIAARGPHVWAAGACRADLRHATPAEVVADARALADAIAAQLG